MIRLLRRWGIRSRLLLVALIPATLVTLALSAFFIWSRVQDSQRYLLELGRTQIEHLAATVGFPLYSGDLATLERALEQTVALSEVRMAAVLDSELKMLANVGAGPRPLRLPEGLISGEPLYPGSSLLIFSRPVRADAMETAQEPLSDAPQAWLPGPVLGWVYLGLDRDALAARERVILITSLGVAALVLSLSVVLALGISNSVAFPVRRLTDTLLRLRGGQLDVRVPEDSGGELGTLEFGFNRMAAATAESQRLLRAQVKEATADLQQTLGMLERRNRELLEAHRQTLAADRAKSEFLARMSHEIRTPINAVIGFTDLMQKSTDRAERAEFADTANRAASTLLAVIDGILAFSRLEQGGVELEQVPFDPRQVVEDVVAMFAPSTQDQGLELVLLVEAGLAPLLAGDPKALTEILMNLLSNAVKFTSSGEILVRAGPAPDGAGLEFSVADTGIGIDDAAKQRLFNPFVQADTSIRRRFGGTGLGLVICKGLIELAGGSIEVDDHHPRGTRFRVQLPWPAVSAPEAEAPERLLEGCLTLLYDDHPQSRRALRNQLLGLGAELFQTRDLGQMESLLDERRRYGKPFRLLVLGLGRGELTEDGLTVLLTRVRVHHPGPLLVLASAAPGYAPAGQARQPGLLCRSKPIRRRLLRDSLIELLGGHRVEELPAPDAPMQGFPGLRVLIAEDHGFNQALMQRLLVPLGCELTLATDGRQALELASDGRFDLILMDLHMPELDGLAAAREIRAGTGPNRETPIVALTADLLAGALLEESGINELLFKPVTQEQLVKALQHWTGNRGEDMPEGASAPGRSSSRELLKDELYPALLALVEQLRQNLALGDLEQFGEQAHQLAGLGGYFELSTFEVAARQLNRLAEQGAEPRELRASLERVAALLARAPGLSSPGQAEAKAEDGD